MNDLIWSEKISVNDEIDNQHQRLFELFNSLHESVTLGKESFAEEKLNELFDFALEHFEKEELFFKYHSYPGEKAHKKEHNELTAKVVELQKQVQTGDLLITLDLLEFLHDWLINHTSITDMLFSDFLRNEVK